MSKKQFCMAQQDSAKHWQTKGEQVTAAVIATILCFHILLKFYIIHVHGSPLHSS